VFPEEEESDDESDAEMEVDDEVDEEAFEFMSDSAMAVSCSLQVKDRKMWRGQVKSADTVRSHASPIAARKPRAGTTRASKRAKHASLPQTRTASSGTMRACLKRDPPRAR
jgi:hypothetical protein